MLAIPQETEDLARRLAAKLGKTPEDVVRDAVAQIARASGLSQQPTASDRAAMLREANAIALRSAALPTLDTRAEDDILG